MVRDWRAGKFVETRNLGDAHFAEIRRVAGGFTVLVSSSTNRYLVTGVPSFHLDDVCRVAPVPNDTSDKTVLTLVPMIDHYSVVNHDLVVVRVDHSNYDRAYCQTGALYVLDTFGEQAPMPLRAEPAFKIVAIDSTATWPENVREAAGQVMSIYTYDSEQLVIRPGPITSHHLMFIENQFQSGMDDNGHLPGLPNVDCLDYENFGRDAFYMPSGEVAALANQESVTNLNKQYVLMYRLTPDKREAQRFHFLLSQSILEVQQIESHYDAFENKAPTPTP